MKSWIFGANNTCNYVPCKPTRIIIPVSSVKDGINDCKINATSVALAAFSIGERSSDSHRRQVSISKYFNLVSVPIHQYIVKCTIHIIQELDQLDRGYRFRKLCKAFYIRKENSHIFIGLDHFASFINCFAIDRQQTREQIPFSFLLL